MPAARKPARREPKWFSMAEATEYTELSDDTLRRYIADGYLPVFQLPSKHGRGQLRFKREDLDALFTPVQVAVG